MTLTSLDRSILALLPPSGLDADGKAVTDAPAGVRAVAVSRHLRLPLGEVREILRGLEAVGRAQQVSGWWRQA